MVFVTKVLGKTTKTFIVAKPFPPVILKTSPLLYPTPILLIVTAVTAPEAVISTVNPFPVPPKVGTFVAVT